MMMQVSLLPLQRRGLSSQEAIDQLQMGTWRLKGQQPANQHICNYDLPYH